MPKFKFDDPEVADTFDLTIALVAWLRSQEVDAKNGMIALRSIMELTFIDSSETPEEAIMKCRAYAAQVETNIHKMFDKIKALD